jgi:hypothetical protein
MAQQMGNRRKHFDAWVVTLAPMIRELQSEKILNVSKLAKRLNFEGFNTPSGRPFTYSTMYRILQRAKELGVAEGPRSLSTAASNRAYQFRGDRHQRIQAMKNRIQSASAQ